MVSDNNEKVDNFLNLEFSNREQRIPLLIQLLRGRSDDWDRDGGFHKLTIHHESLVDDHGEKINNERHQENDL